MISHKNKKTQFSIYVVQFSIMLLPLLWVTFFEFAGFSFKPVHISLFLFATAIFLSPSLLRDGIIFYRLSKYFWITYIICLLVPVISIAYNTPKSGGYVFFYVFKQFVYFIYSFMMGTTLFNLLRNKDTDFINQRLTISSMLSLLLLAFVAYYSARINGQDIAQEYTKALLSGNSLAMRYGVYQKLFNYQLFDTAVSDDPDDIIQSNLINTIAGAFILFLILANFTLRQVKRSLFMFVVSIFVVLVSVFLCLTSFSRSNIISLVLTVGTVGLVSFLFKGKQDFNKQIKIILMLSFFLLPIMLFSMYEYINNILDIVTERLLDLDSDGRIGQFEQAFDLINNAIFLGNGGGTFIISAFEELPVHNILLSFWIQYGILGFIAVTLFNITIISYMVSVMRKSINSPSYWKISLPLSWVMALPILPLFRMQIEGGGISIIEWFCLATFFAIIIANKHKNKLARSNSR